MLLFGQRSVFRGCNRITSQARFLCHVPLDHDANTGKALRWAPVDGRVSSRPAGNRDGSRIPRLAISLAPSVRWAASVEVMADVHPHAASADLSSQHFWSAEVFAGNALQIEEEFSDKECAHGVYSKHQAYASGAVLSTVAFLEAYINELFYHCSLTLGGAPIDGLDRDQQATLGRMSRRGVPRTARYPVLEKYDIALDLLAKAPLGAAAQPYQDASSLVKLRNALVHYEPEFYPVPGPLRDSVDPRAAPSLEKRLRSKFPLNPLAATGYGFFPDHCLSAGCAAWAVEVSLSFVKSFVERVGIVERKSPIADRWRNG